MSFSAFDVVEQVDTWPYYQRDPEAYKKHISEYYYFMIKGYEKPFGYSHVSFVTGMTWPSFWEVDHTRRMLTLLPAPDFGGRTDQMQETLWRGYEEAKGIRKWFKEPFLLRDHSGTHILNIDGCGVDLLGVVSYGIHVTGFVRTEEGIKYWVPQRSKNKSTFPGMLDNFCSGNLVGDERPFDGMVREIAEETAIPDEYTRAHARSCGTVTYQMSVTNDGGQGCQHHCQYVYELELPEDMIPRPNDGEVECFTLMNVDEVQKAIAEGKFTPNRTMTYLGHFVRHGIVNAENEENIAEICSRLHRKHDLLLHNGVENRTFKGFSTQNDIYSVLDLRKKKNYYGCVKEVRKSVSLVLLCTSYHVPLHEINAFHLARYKVALRAHSVTST